MDGQTSFGFSRQCARATARRQRPTLRHNTSDGRRHGDRPRQSRISTNPSVPARPVGAVDEKPRGRRLKRPACALSGLPFAPEPPPLVITRSSPILPCDRVGRLRDAIRPGPCWTRWPDGQTIGRVISYRRMDTGAAHGPSRWRSPRPRGCRPVRSTPPGSAENRRVPSWPLTAHAHPAMAHGSGRSVSHSPAPPRPRRPSCRTKTARRRRCCSPGGCPAHSITAGPPHSGRHTRPHRDGAPVQQRVWGC